MTQEIRHDSTAANAARPPIAVLDGIMAQFVLASGDVLRLAADEALARLASEPHMVCHAAYLVGRLSLTAGPEAKQVAGTARAQKHFDVAELFAFVAPAVMATPAPHGFARALGLSPGPDDAVTVRDVADELLERLTRPNYPHLREAAEINSFLARTNWPWASPVARAITRARPDLDVAGFATGLNVWDRLAEWEDDGPRPPGSHKPVSEADARAELSRILGSSAEKRQSQMEYCSSAVTAFKPREDRSENHILLAEAGTGLGKTLGYLAPAWLWAKANNEPVWVSTYTKNLQRQLEQELARVVPDPAERRQRVVVRKGRENYVCLLNMQEAFARMTASNPSSALMAALTARWARYSRDGDMIGGDFPSWLLPLLFDAGQMMRLPTPMALGLTDRRGECIYSACPHYRKCFIEKAVRASRKADIVVANHALVLHHIAVSGALDEPDDDDDKADSGGMIHRLVFDEGHHLFDAADSAFSGHLSGLETAELRRWIRGPETRSRRGRSLKDRLGELIDDDKASLEHLDAIIVAARFLAGPGWQQRVQAGSPEGSAEIFLTLVRQQVLARAGDRGGGNTLETDCRPMIDGLAEAAGNLAAGLIDLKRPMLKLAERLLKKLDEEAGDLNSNDRARIEAMARSLKRRGELVTGGWIDMLARLMDEPREEFVDWFSVTQNFGREIDAGLHSHWVDPSEPLAAAVLARADGIIITSATLKDRPPELPDDWQNAEMRTGVVHLPWPVSRAGFSSPFNYAEQSRIIVVNDVNREDMDQIAAAYREMFLAAGGASLGLFTAISRLRAVHRRIAPAITAAGLPLYAQHVDPMDTGTLVDMFRAEPEACLLGTDAVRDGVDVPGDSLRLMVLDRVPWGQPTILERARRARFGGSRYQDMIVRLRLRQAFGRLIRRAYDRGVFVVLDSRLASRFATAFPDGVAIERMGLVDALQEVSGFFGKGN